MGFGARKSFTGFEYPQILHHWSSAGSRPSRSLRSRTASDFRVIKIWDRAWDKRCALTWKSGEVNDANRLKVAYWDLKWEKPGHSSDQFAENIHTIIISRTLTPCHLSCFTHSPLQFNASSINASRAPLSETACASVTITATVSMTISGESWWLSRGSKLTTWTTQCPPNFFVIRWWLAIKDTLFWQ